jgi:hypothetical protein
MDTEQLTLEQSLKKQIYSQHYTEWGKTESISSKIRNDTKISTLSTLI